MTHILIIHGNTEMDQFYQLVYELNNSRKCIEQKDELEKYKGIVFNQLKEDEPENFDYFFTSDKVSIKNGKITLPGFFVERKLGNIILEDITNNSFSFYIVTGARMSGKSYLLLQLLRSLPPSSTYYLPMKINDEILGEIFKKQNCYFVMEQVALTIDQIKTIFDNIDKIEKNKTKVIIVVSIDDKDLLQVYQQRNIIASGRIKIYNLEKKLTDEIHKFNKHVAQLRLMNYTPKDTILDYLFRVEADRLNNKHKRILPEIHFLGNTDIELIKAMIVLTVEKVIPMSMAIDLQIETALLELSRKYPITVQKDYLSNIESVDDNSRYKFVNNSPYWTMRCLSVCAENASNHKAIAAAFYSLICVFERRYRTENNLFNQC